MAVSCSIDFDVGVVYLIRKCEHVNSNQPIYKIGKTMDIMKQLNDPKNSEIICYTQTNNHTKCEADLLNLFHDNFIYREDVGLKYFEGNIDLMQSIMTKYFMTKYKIKCIEVKEEKIIKIFE